ncbi:MAG: hypothetical protein ACREFE_14005 [Limisphaerales bacterium]
MKTIRAFIIGITVVIGIAGCSTSSSKVATTRQIDSNTATMVEDARLLYEMGQLDAAEKKLQVVLAAEPANAKAHYYLDLVHQAANRKPQPLGYYQTIPQQPIY